jgi:hypothetical protein
MLCSIEGCDKSYFSRGWCKKHYARWLAHGDPNFSLHGKPLVYLKEHMYDGCCSDWPFARNVYGYAWVRFNGKNVRASHWVCEQVNGPAPPGKPFALHKCGKGHLGCFNAGCLYWGSKKDNSRDSIEVGTWTHGETHGCAKLFTEEVVEIRRLYGTGNYSQQQLADMFNVSSSHISRIVNFQSRRNG